MMTRTRSAGKENSSKAIRTPGENRCGKTQLRSKSEMRICVRRSVIDFVSQEAKRVCNEEPKSPVRLKSPEASRAPLSPSNAHQAPTTPTKNPITCKRSLLFNSSEKKPFPSRFQLPTSPVKTPQETPKPEVKQVNLALGKDPALAVYESVSKNLNPSSKNGEIIGREMEIRDIRKFLTEKLDTRSSGSLYISGGPGTGKTACLSLIIAELGLRSVFVNCLSKPSPAALLKEVAAGLGVKTNISDTSVLMKAIERYTCGRRDPVVVVLDEIDDLTSKFQENLYALFSLPAKKDSRLVLVGVANALDLTTRVLPHLKWLSPETRPVLIHFPPYSRYQLGQIISKRLGAEGGRVIPPLVVQYVAGKVANLNGDCRRALEVCRACVDRKKAVSRRQLVLKPESTSEDQNSDIAFAEVKAVTLPEVAKVFGEGIGMGIGKTSADAEEGGALPLLQKLALVSLWAAMTKTKKEPVVTLAKLYEVFRKVCVRTGSMTSVVSKSEFSSLCALLESRGVVELRDGMGVPKTPTIFKSPRCTSVILRTGLATLERDLRSDDSAKVFAQLLNDPSSIS